MVLPKGEKSYEKTIISSLLSVALLSSYPLVNKVGANTLDDADNVAQTGSKTVASETTDKSQTGHEGMEHDESGEIPEGSEVTIQTDHMPGMMGATGEVVGAFDSIAYEITYNDTKTGEEVANHKWVVHEEVENAQDEPYQAGDEVVLEAYHMPGMQGATAIIDSAEDTTVYMVTYTDTETDDTVENHKWLIEELGQEEQFSNQFWRARTVEEVRADVSQYDTLEELQNYEVVWGDTLWAISQSTNFSVDDLTEAFNIENADLIFANYTLENQPSLENSYDTQTVSESKTTEGMDNMGDMKHDESGEIPEGLEVAENPMYEVGESVILQHGHMPGMEGAEATVSGVFATTAYEVSFNPTNGGEREENHRWVIHEEISESTKGAFEPGEEVTLEANHMEGIEGATAIIDDAVTTNVYMVDYQPTDGRGSLFIINGLLKRN
ncbi:LysM domain-containing protein [Atopostipes suicloacalis DSM 15692]|uniref:LysM domain-containing protein n=1 Tax=Atopostipes suicloacalis DSM 15692 TaxID=1121025 RepID=A0A1M4S8U2_9LACT|nr:DUF1541 domain-containing protein [Atopostipes suicloacalis]SHE28575.1 LysM domain-containing protein [Atopostipes suicloacalis DSM 15692]